MTRLRIPRLTSTSIIGSGLVVLAAVAYALHLIFPSRPIGETLIGGFLAAGVHIWALPQGSAPTINPPAQPGTGEHP